VDTVKLTNLIMFGVVMVGWFGLGIGLILRPRGAAQEPTARRDRRCWLGMGLQGVGFALVWSLQRPFEVPFLELSAPALWFLAAVTVCLVVVELNLVAGAFRALGRQWSAEARVLQAHSLVTEGPFARVRHPIYAGLMALLFATALARSYWPALAAAAVLGAVGTTLRIRVEEALLRATFGEAYNAYARKVPAIIPRWHIG
jgi:protein-S-isoprenylcysteine O-methyltransferase Ste14